MPVFPTAAGTAQELAYRISGRGRPSLILIHGLYDGGFVWSPLQSCLGETYCSLALDLRGHGESPWDDAHRYDVQSYSGDVVTLVDSLDLTDVSLIGHSLGAEVAIHVCAARPQRVRNLIMIDGGPVVSTSAGHMLLNQLSEMPRTYSTRDEFLDILATRHPFASRASLQDYAASALSARPDGDYRLKSDPAVLLAGSHVSPEFGVIALQGLKHPKLLIRGTASSVLTRTLARDLSSSAHDCRFAEISHSGHCVPLDNPAGLSEAITTFLKQDQPCL